MHVTSASKSIAVKLLVCTTAPFATFSRTNFVKLLASRFGTRRNVIDQHENVVLPP